MLLPSIILILSWKFFRGHIAFERFLNCLVVFDIELNPIESFLSCAFILNIQALYDILEFSLKQLRESATDFGSSHLIL